MPDMKECIKRVVLKVGGIGLRSDELVSVTDSSLLSVW